jgi:hypothetical protein
VFAGEGRTLPGSGHQDWIGPGHIFALGVLTKTDQTLSGAESGHYLGESGHNLTCACSGFDC